MLGTSIINMKNFKNILLSSLFILSFIFSPLLSFAQFDGDNYDPNCPSGNYNDCFGTGSGTNSNSSNSSSSSASVVTCKLSSSPKFQDLVVYVNCIINLSIIPLFFTIAVAFFVYGVVQYMLANADESKRETGKQYMVWGIIALTVMVTMWGLVNILAGTFGLDSGFIPQVKP